MTFKPSDDPVSFAGCRYWTSSLLPALVGTTLPFWLRPPGFSFRWLPAIEFLIATVLFHAGFSFLLAKFEGRSTTGWKPSRLLGAAGVCIAAGCLLGLHLNTGLKLHSGVHESIFLLYGFSVLFAGILYVSPPFNFFRRAGGEVVLCEGLGMIPVLGAYVVQVGDLTRTVYIASIPLVVSTGLWVWVSELISREEDERAGRDTLVRQFPPAFSGRYGTLMLIVLLYATIVMAVFLRSSLPPLSLVSLLTAGLALQVLRLSWNEYGNAARMQETRRHAYVIHFSLCIISSVSSLVTLLR